MLLAMYKRWREEPYSVHVRNTAVSFVTARESDYNLFSHTSRFFKGRGRINSNKGRRSQGLGQQDSVRDTLSPGQKRDLAWVGWQLRPD